MVPPAPRLVPVPVWIFARPSRGIRCDVTLPIEHFTTIILPSINHCLANTEKFSPTKELFLKNSSKNTIQNTSLRVSMTCPGRTAGFSLGPRDPKWLDRRENRRPRN